MDPPQVVVIQLLRGWSLEAVHLAALRIQPRHHMPNGAVLARRIQRLEHNQQSQRVLRIELLLILSIFLIAVLKMFLFLIISMRELTKDLENIKGDLALDYKTIPIVYGEKASKIMLVILSFLTLIPAYLLLYKFEVGRMNLYFYFSIVLLIVFVLMVLKSNTKIHYLILHNILKFIIISGVLSILLIDVNVILRHI